MADMHDPERATQPRLATVITFTSLFPSHSLPTHGLFVRERMRRVVAAAGWSWCVVAPVPTVPRMLRRGEYRTWASMPEHEQVDGVDVWHPRYRHLPGFSTGRQARSMARGARDCVARIVAAAGGPVVLDAHYVYPDGVAAARIGAALEIPVVVTARGSDVNVLPGHPGVARQIRRILPDVAARFAVSERLRRRFARVAGIDDAAVELARNGVDLERFRPGDRAAARQELGLPIEGRIVLGVGRLVRAKGFHLAAEAVASLPATRLVLVGDGPERDRLRAEDHVTLLGRQPPDRVALAYRAADVSVLPSEREGWPNCVTESLASGVPVVATDVGSVAEMLADPVCGTMVPQGDARALAAALRSILDRPPSPAAVREAAQRFSWDAPVDLLVARLGEVLSA